MGKASEKVARDKAREAKKTKAMSLPRWHNTPNHVELEKNVRLIVQEDEEGEG